jgi:DNA-binding CsgD family transcriptional regulator
LVKCKLCDKWFTALTDTFLSCAQLNYRQIYLLALLLAIHKDNQTIADIMQVSPETVRRWRRKFEEMGALNR